MTKELRQLRRIILNSALSGTEVRVFFHLLGHCETATDVSDSLGVPLVSVLKSLKKLRSLGLVEQIGSAGRAKILTAVLRDQSNN